MVIMVDCWVLFWAVYYVSREHYLYICDEHIFFFLGSTKHKVIVLLLIVLKHFISDIEDMVWLFKDEFNAMETGSL